MTAPKKYVLNEMVTVDVIFRQAGVPADPTSFDLVVAKPDDADTTYEWPTAPGPIVRDSAGVFHADLEADVKGLWTFRYVAAGSGTSAAEGTFWVQSKVIDNLDLLVGAEDIEAIRQLLGVTDTDVEDHVIEGLMFAGQAEFIVKSRFEDWEVTYAEGEKNSQRMRFAAGYLTAALIAETYAQGGMIGLAHDGRLADRNWPAEAARLRGVAERWLSELTSEGDPVSELFNVPMVLLSGSRNRGGRAIAAPRTDIPDWANGWPATWGGWSD